MRHERVLAGCVGKIQYPTKGAAMRRMNGQMGRKKHGVKDGWGRRTMMVYRCGHCHCWHVGGSNEVRRQDRFDFDLESPVLAMVPEAILAKVAGR